MVKDVCWRLSVSKMSYFWTERLCGHRFTRTWHQLQGKLGNTCRDVHTVSVWYTHSFSDHHVSKYGVKYYLQNSLPLLASFLQKKWKNLWWHIFKRIKHRSLLSRIKRFINTTIGKICKTILVLRTMRPQTFRTYLKLTNLVQDNIKWSLLGERMSLINWYETNSFLPDKEKCTCLKTHQVSLK
jgi:hypothetical protein